MSLVLDEVTAGYGGATVVRDVSLTVPRGRAVALLGANGAGKTTLLRACSGLVRPTRGRILLDGVDVSRASPHALQDMGVCHVPEGRAVFPSLSVAENLRLMAGAPGEEALERAVEAFPVLGQRMRQRAGTLSGGEQQMLALARTYVTAPDFVLLDEVSIGLAPLVVDEIFAFLGRLAAEGAALLIVEQYAAKALQLGDLVYVLTKGRVSFAGEPSEIDAEALAEAYLGAGPTSRSAAAPRGDDA